MKQSQNHLEILSTIQKSEVSDIVYEKIIAEIESRKKNEPSVHLVWTYGIAASLAFMLSLCTIIYHYQHENKINQFAETMNLIPNNSLYN